MLSNDLIRSQKQVGSLGCLKETKTMIIMLEDTLFSSLTCIVLVSKKHCGNVKC